MLRKQSKLKRDLTRFINIQILKILLSELNATSIIIFSMFLLFFLKS